ncbi:4'-phosphopantetheinyl transferase family protein [Photobacterium leiognathi]|uniref:4'-phosphopantetheinyl transferase family protein n=1 Tax=Photobacterium leiognathi TaxID=553611 RepID=UPI002738EF0F|nr:4'-phosphopantetheinyl transferase superfamily protein [Photobacterium leiognathi]
MESEEHQMNTLENNRLSACLIANSIHVKERPLVFWATVPDYFDDTNFKACLSSQEKERATHFHCYQDRNNYIIAHSLKRILLGAITGIEPLKLSFKTNDYGKPELATSQSETDIQFNLSHTKGLVAVAMAYQIKVGVDVEWFDKKIDIFNIARSFFSEQDMTLLNLLPWSHKNKGFFHLWSLKEAFIKAIGKGLSIPLNSFYVDALTQKNQIFDGRTRKPLGWVVHSTMPTKVHYLSVVTECQSENQPAPSLHEISFEALLGIISKLNSG